jgi:hypothetical protein
MHALASILALSAAVLAQSAEPRIGKWKNKDNPSNVMTYEAVAGGGMKVTVENVNQAGEKNQWGYTTMIDGKDAPIQGDRTRDSAAVRRVDKLVNEIVYKKDGKVSQLATNAVSEDGKTLTVTFRTPEGKQTGVAVYQKMQ